MRKLTKNYKQVTGLVLSICLHSLPAYAATDNIGQLSDMPLFVDRGVTTDFTDITEIKPNIILLFDNSGSMRNCVDSNRSCRYNITSQRLTHLKAAATKLIDSLVQPDSQLPKVNLGLARFDGRDVTTDILAPVYPITHRLNTNVNITEIQQQYKCTKARRKRNINCDEYGDLLTSSISENQSYLFSDYLKSKIESMEASSMTPLAESLTQVGYYFAKGFNKITTNTNTKPKSVFVTDFFHEKPNVVSFDADIINHLSNVGNVTQTTGDPTRLSWRRSYS